MSILDSVSQTTIDWLTEDENPAVSVLFRRRFGLAVEKQLSELWSRRNEYEPVRRILEAMRADGSWIEPEKDYQKYHGSLWQIIFLGEMWANPDDERVQKAVEYTFSRQTRVNTWSVDERPATAGWCLGANVARSLARLGFSRDERIVNTISWTIGEYRRQGYLGCPSRDEFTLNGYCHMVTPKVLLFLSEVPRELWPDGADKLKDACVAALRDKQVHRCHPKQTRAFQEAVWPRGESMRARERREVFIKENAPIEWTEKPGWLRFGFPLSYNSDALEALAALAAIGEGRRPEYDAALQLVRKSADKEMCWTMKNSFNGKMIADVEEKGRPSKWLTLRALSVLDHFDA